MRTKKARAIIAAEDVARVFDDSRIRALAKIAKLPAGADIVVFGEGVREAARIFARDARISTGNELRTEIEELNKAVDPAKPRRWDLIVTLWENLSPKARTLLNPPSADAVRDPERREAACDAIAKLTQIGGRWIEGRRRPTGKRSRPTWRPVLHAPEPQRNFPKRAAERDFVMWIRIAWLDATGERPASTARHSDDSRKIGPFARFARECLRLVGAGDVDVVELINELDHRRRCMEKRASKKCSCQLSNPDGNRTPLHLGSRHPPP
jgi:hypothetical protein